MTELLKCYMTPPMCETSCDSVKQIRTFHRLFGRNMNNPFTHVFKTVIAFLFIPKKNFSPKLL